MALVVENILQLVGKTPLVRVHQGKVKERAEILGKLEYYNPGGSVKDRIGLHILAKAEEEGLIGPETVLVEATSGNTGIGLAMAAAVKGYPLVLVMPETMSIERQTILKAYGAQLLLTPGNEGMKGSIAKTEALLKENPNYFCPGQFINPSNPEIHYLTTGSELWQQCGGKIDAFVVGIGTGGTITGVGTFLKEKAPKIKIVGVEPEGSPVLSGGKPGPHKIQGIGAGFIPPILKRDLIDEIIRVEDVDAFITARKLAKEEGLMVGISSGAALFGALQVAEDLGPGKRVVVVLPDTGERYLSMAPYFSLDLKARELTLEDI